MSVDFSLVEQLRERALLRKKDMATLFGVTQLSYMNWLKGKPIRKTKEARVTAVLSELVKLIQDEGWPSPATARLTGKKRFDMLRELLPSQKQEPIEAEPIAVAPAPEVAGTAEVTTQ